MEVRTVTWRRSHLEVPKIYPWEISMGNPPFMKMYLLFKMVVFHCYVSLPESSKSNAPKEMVMKRAHSSKLNESMQN